MKTIQVTIPEYIPVTEAGVAPTIPVSIPALADVVQLAKAFHAAGQGWEGTALDWPADYTPELYEANAVFEEYDENGIAHTVTADRWSPAMFCMGVNDIWFVSLSWELGIDSEPWIYLEDDYGYDIAAFSRVTLVDRQ